METELIPLPLLFHTCLVSPFRFLSCIENAYSLFPHSLIHKPILRCKRIYHLQHENAWGVVNIQWPILDTFQWPKMGKFE